MNVRSAAHINVRRASYFCARFLVIIAANEMRLPAQSLTSRVRYDNHTYLICLSHPVYRFQLQAGFLSEAKPYANRRCVYVSAMRGKREIACREFRPTGLDQKESYMRRRLYVLAAIFTLVSGFMLASLTSNKVTASDKADLQTCAPCVKAGYA